jgi:hypothetical protein
MHKETKLNLAKVLKQTIQISNLSRHFVFKTFKRKKYNLDAA